MVALFFDAAQVRDLTVAAHAGLGKASGSLKTTEPHVFHTLRPLRGRPCPVQALTEVVWGPRSVRKWYTKTNRMVAVFFDTAQVRDLTGAAHAGLGKASGSLKTTKPHVFHTLRPRRGRPCPVQALTEVVWGPRSVRKWYTRKSGWWLICFDAPEVRDMTGAAHAGVGKASRSLPTKEPHVFHTLRPCRRRPRPVQALTEVFWGPRSVRKRYTKKSGWWHVFSMQHKFVT